MKYKTLIIAISVLFATQAAEARQQVFKLAVEKVGNRTDTDVIDLTSRGPNDPRNNGLDAIDQREIITRNGVCRLTKVMFDVDRDGIDISNLSVEFGNGQTQALVIDRSVGQRYSAWIGLNGEQRCVKRIYLTARSDKDRGRGDRREASVIRFFGCVADKRPLMGQDCRTFNPDADNFGRDGLWGRDLFVN
jgi:hypothetical protein